MARANGGWIKSTDRSLTVAGLTAGSTLAPEGAVLLSTRAPIGYTALLPKPTAFNQGCKAVVPRSSLLDSRFLQYSLISATEDLKAAGSGSTFLELSSEALSRHEIPLVEVEEQRRIADFLNDRVFRIDRIITARRRQAQLLEETLPNLIARELKACGAGTPQSVEAGWEGRQLPDGWRASTLGRVLRQLTNGYVGPTRDILVDDGVRYIQSVHIKNGTIDFDRRPFFVSEEWHADRRRINLRAGDVLIVQTGAIGQVALVPEDFGEASCHALLIARTDRLLISPEYLAAFLQSNFGKQAMLARATGALHPHLEAGVRSTPLLLPPRSVQDQIVDQVREDQQELRAGIRDLDRSIALLTAYRSSLITAAVTGELDVTTASSTIPG